MNRIALMEKKKREIKREMDNSKISLKNKDIKGEKRILQHYRGHCNMA